MGRRSLCSFNSFSGSRRSVALWRATPRRLSQLGPKWPEIDLPWPEISGHIPGSAEVASGSAGGPIGGEAACTRPQQSTAGSPQGEGNGAAVRRRPQKRLARSREREACGSTVCRGPLKRIVGSVGKLVVGDAGHPNVSWSRASHPEAMCSLASRWASANSSGSARIQKSSSLGHANTSRALAANDTVPVNGGRGTANPLLPAWPATCYTQ